MRLVSRLTVLTAWVVLGLSVIPTAAAVPPCNKLLTQQDITKVAGPGFDNPAGCVYLRYKDQAGHYVEDLISLGIKEVPSGAGPSLVMLSSTFASAGNPVVAASGLGQGAFYTEDKDAGATTVFFGKGNLTLQLTYQVKQSNPKSALALARVIYGRL